MILGSPHKITPFKPMPNGPDYHHPVVSAANARWLADHGAKCECFGDGVSIEDGEEDVDPPRDIRMTINYTFHECCKILSCYRRIPSSSRLSLC